MPKNIDESGQMPSWKSEKTQKQPMKEARPGRNDSLDEI